MSTETARSDDSDIDRDSDDDEAVSRWSTFLPASRGQWVALVAALLFLAGALGYFLGVRDTDAPSAGSVDVGFLQDMITHHEQAIQMALIENGSGVEPGVQTFAREIILFQSYEIGLMERQLNEWGYRRENRPDTAMGWMNMPVAASAMPGLASENEIDALEDHTGRDVDALWLKLMQDHHAGGVHMAEYAAQHASDPFVREIAARMARNQRIEIGELEAARGRADLPANPPGYEAAVIPAEDPSRSGG